jgi:uncharacterized protein YidB (DUF937 family)
MTAMTAEESSMGLLDGIVGDLLGNLPGAARQAPGTGGTDGGNSVLTALLPIVLGMLMNRQGGAATGAEGGGGLSDVLGGMLGGARGSQGGGLGDVLGGMLGGAGGAGGTLGAVLGSVLGGGASGASGAGGLGSLLEQFQRAGFAEQANSWVGTGQNLPLPPGAIGQVFGSDTLAQIAQQVGVTEAEAAEGLSQLLPEVVDRFTPEGKAPDLDQLAASVTALTRQFGG